MTSPQPPLPHEYLMYLRETNQMEEAAQYEQYLRETGQEHAIGQATRQAEYQSGRMGRRMERLNTNDREMAAADIAAERNTSGLRGAGIRGLGALTALGRDIPGVEALQAGARAGALTLGERIGLPVEGQSYGEALGDIRSAQAEVNPVSRTGLGLIGGGLSAAALPMGAAGQGATYGSMLNLLSADPDKTMGERAGTAIAGGIFGGAAGKVGDIALTGARALFAPTAERALNLAQQTRANATRPLYRQALEVEGTMPAQRTPDLQAFLDAPDIAPIVSRLGQMRQYQGLAPDDPRMLDAIYKELSDQSGRLQIAAKRGTADPRNPNAGRAAAEDVALARQQGLDAISRSPGAPMPTYAPAVSEYAAQTAAGPGALRAGYRSMRNLGKTEGNIGKKGMGALSDVLEGQPQMARDRAAEGILGYIKEAGADEGIAAAFPFRTSPFRRTLLNGGDYLRKVRPKNQSFLEYLQATGVAGATPDINLP